MVFSESGDFLHRPELKDNQPSEMFNYAKDMEQLFRQRVSEQQLPENIDYLVNELEAYVTKNFTNKFEPLPEMTISSSDIYQTGNITLSEDGSTYSINVAPIPLEGDPAADVYFDRTITGTLYGFHRGMKNDFRVYVDINEEPQDLMGGKYTKLLSVGVQNSQFSLIKEQIEEREQYILQQQDIYGEEIRGYVDRLLATLGGEESTLHRLKISSTLLAQIAMHPHTSPQFVDALTEVITLNLHLNFPQDIATKAHQVVITERPTQSYKQQGAAEFQNITPQLGLLGESVNRSLGLFFLHEGQAVRIPVQYITSIDRYYTE